MGHCNLAGHQCPPSRVEGTHQTPDSALTSVLLPESRRPLGESRTAESQGPQEHCFPTEAKVREKNRKKADQEQGVTRTVKKRPKVVEDHHDDCGEDLTSLWEREDAAYVMPCDYDTDEALSDEEHDLCLLETLGDKALAFPIDPTGVPRATPGEPSKGRDPRAPPPHESPCPACRCFRARNDWEHIRIVGGCSYPHDDPWIPACEACQLRKRADDHRHSFKPEECKFAVQAPRKFAPRGRDRPHEVEPKADSEPTAAQPAQVDGIKPDSRSCRNVSCVP